MPFTFAHPAAILPLSKIKIGKRRIFDMTALVAGSMAPDFEYFLHLRPYQEHGHTLLGQFYYNLPLLIIASFIYHTILKEPLISRLPRPLCDNYSYIAQTKWKLDSFKKIGVVAYSSILGMLTHLLWDSFTHRLAYFVNKIEWLNSNINLFELTIPAYKIAQHGSTIVGLAILAIYLLKIRDKSSTVPNPVPPRSKLFYWISILVLSLTIYTLTLWILRDWSIGRLVVVGIDSFFIGLTVISFIISRFNNCRSKSSLVKKEEAKNKG